MSRDQPTGDPMGEIRQLQPVNDPISDDGVFPLNSPPNFTDL